MAVAANDVFPADAYTNGRFDFAVESKASDGIPFLRERFSLAEGVLTSSR